MEIYEIDALIKAEMERIEGSLSDDALLELLPRLQLAFTLVSEYCAIAARDKTPTAIAQADKAVNDLLAGLRRQGVAKTA